jgi:hypothetical protein
MNPLNPELHALLRRAAELRAAGQSWPSVARQIEIDENVLIQLTRDHHATYRKLLRSARSEVFAEGTAEAFLFLRKLLRSEDERISWRAAESMLKFTMTLVRHRKRKPAGKADPRLANLSETDLIFAQFLAGHTDEQLAELAFSLRNVPLRSTADTPPTPPANEHDAATPKPEGKADGNVDDDSDTGDGPLGDGVPRRPQGPSPPSNPGQDVPPVPVDSGSRLGHAIPRGAVDPFGRGGVRAEPMSDPPAATGHGLDTLSCRSVPVELMWWSPSSWSRPPPRLAGRTRTSPDTGSGA